MKIQCQSCQAKYTIADEKVLGKVVKIRCKKCSATIVINGNETRAADDSAETQAFDYTGQGNEPWTVNVADGDQRTMTAQEIVTEYRNNVVNDETYCWKDGMADWLPLREIEQLYGIVKLGPRVSLHDDSSLVPQSAPPPAAPLFGDGSTQESPFAGAALANGNGNGVDNAHAAVPAAARRGGGRGQGADLFGNVASAGGEDDVMTSAATGMSARSGGGGAATAAAQDDQKLTGQRNENSVLFSLSALTSNEKQPAPTAANRTTATADGSGLIDIRALSQTMGSDEKKDTTARVDDIMNLSGGGAFGAALAAPILAPPPLEMSDHGGGYDTGGSKPNKMIIFAFLGGGAFIAMAIVVVFLLLRPAQPAADGTPSGTSSVGASPTGAGTGSAAVAANDTANPGATTAAPAGDAPPTPGTGTPAGVKPGTSPASKPGAVAAATPKDNGTKPATPEAAPTAAKPEPPKDFGSALAAAAGKPAETPQSTGGGGSTAPFDRGAATAALAGVNAQSCKKPDGPTGSGHVKITFAPNGSVSSAVVDGGPFPGTPVGGCVAGKFRGAHIPAFSGGPVSVGKSFTIN